jgi:hypothetical protein
VPHRYRDEGRAAVRQEHPQERGQVPWPIGPCRELDDVGAEGTRGADAARKRRCRGRSGEVVAGDDNPPAAGARGGRHATGERAPELDIQGVHERQDAVEERLALPFRASPPATLCHRADGGDDRAAGRAQAAEHALDVRRAPVGEKVDPRLDDVGARAARQPTATPVGHAENRARAGPQSHPPDAQTLPARLHRRQFTPARPSGSRADARRLGMSAAGRSPEVALPAVTPAHAATVSTLPDAAER